MSIVIAGGAGFIGSRLARRLAAAGQEILVLDNLCRGRRDYLAPLPATVSLEEIDLADEAATCGALRAWHARHPIRMVWHLAANSDIPAGVADAHVDMRDTFMTTFSLLEAMKALHLGQLAFASSSAVYGDFGPGTPLHEDLGPLLPISNYGAMKLAAEALISAAAEAWLERAWIFRFPNVVGAPATHGVILDFIRKLKANPAVLPVLGDGSQQKAYLHVDDLLDAMCFITARATEKRNLYNIGPTDAGCTVRAIAEAVAAQVSPQARLAFGEGDRGWVGDVPKFSYSVAKLAALGWQPPHSSLEAVRKAVREIAAQEGVPCAMP